MSYCPECTKEIPAAAVVCPHCGYDFPLDDPKPIARKRRWELMTLAILATVSIIAAIALDGFVDNPPGYARLTFGILGIACLYCARAFWWLDDRIARLESDAARRRRTIAKDHP